MFLNAKYVYNINAMYQLPLNFNLAVSFFGRQGYPVNYYLILDRTGDADSCARSPYCPSTQFVTRT